MIPIYANIQDLKPNPKETLEWAQREENFGKQVIEWEHSIKTEGFNPHKALWVNWKGAIIDGNVRYHLAKKLGIQFVPIDFVFLMDDIISFKHIQQRVWEKQILKKQNKATRHNNKRVIENLHLIKSIGLKIERALIRNDIDAFGRLMHEHWMAKRNLSSGVSSSRIDHLYQLGIKNGALGGKIMGAGGGGFLLFCCPEGKTQVRKAIEKEGLTELFFHFDMEGTKVIADF